MEKNDEPIFGFLGLKTYLKSIGVAVADASAGYKPVPIEDVTLEAIKSGKYVFEDDGIFVKDKYDKPHKVFLYKMNYHISGFVNSKPSMHIRKCQVIQDFINRGSFAEYRSANTETVLVRDMDDNYKEIHVNNLRVCGYCKKMILGENPERYIQDSSEYVQLLKEADPEENLSDDSVDVDIFGYTRDWEKISRAIREEHDWTCECCGLKMKSPWDRRFWQVHHKNGIKTDNRKANLECLCIRCHANVDAVHRSNFSEGDKKEMLDEFNRLYPEGKL